MLNNIGLMVRYFKTLGHSNIYIGSSLRIVKYESMFWLYVAIIRNMAKNINTKIDYKKKRKN